MTRASCLIEGSVNSHYFHEHTQQTRHWWLAESGNLENILNNSLHSVNLQIGVMEFIVNLEKDKTRQDKQARVSYHTVASAGSPIGIFSGF